VLGDPQRDGAEPGRVEHVPAVLTQDRLDRGIEPVGRDGPEHIGEEVEPDIVQVGGEALPAGPGQLRDEGRRRPEQHGGIDTGLEMVVAKPAGLVLDRGHAGDNGFGDGRIVAVQARVAGHVGFFADLEYGDGGTVLGDQTLQERAVAGDIAAP
jgi:hypothetical protein